MQRGGNGNGNQIHLPYKLPVVGIEDAKAEGLTLHPANLFYPSLNDLTMKVFESWNHAWQTPEEDLTPDNSENDGEKSDPYKQFASNLHYRMTEHPHTHNLADFLALVPQHGRELRAELSEFIKAKEEVGRVNSYLKKAWWEDHEDNYHSELRTRTVTRTDSKGNSYTDTETYWESVYDDTTHTYKYHIAAGEKASTDLDNLLYSYGDLSLTVNLRASSKMHHAGMKAAFDSRTSPEKTSQLKSVALCGSFHFHPLCNFYY